MDAAMHAAEAAGWRRPRGGAGLRRGLAPRRCRHRRRPDQGTLQPAGLRGRVRGWGRQGIGALGARGRSGFGGDRRAAGGDSGDRRRPCRWRRGFRLRAERLDDFHAFLDERLAGAGALPSAADLVIEGALAVGGATTEVARHLERLAPFGAGNEEPTLVLNRARVVRADRVGREAGSIRAFLEGEGGGPRLKAMLFRAREGALADALLARSEGVPLHLAGHLRAEEWNGSVTPCFVVSDGAVA